MQSGGLEHEAEIPLEPTQAAPAQRKRLSDNEQRGLKRHVCVNEKLVELLRLFVAIAHQIMYPGEVVCLIGI
jgi:hypothetical protein